MTQIDIHRFMANIEKCNCDKIHMVSPAFMHAVIGIQDEAGELAEQLKRALYYGDPISTEHILEEYGDMMFYILLDIRRIARKQSRSVEEVFQEVLDRNVAKLEQRYKERFTEDEATESGRDRLAEQVAMHQEGLLTEKQEVEQSTKELETLSYRAGAKITRSRDGQKAH